MTLGEFLPIRMKEIMLEKGLEPADFIRVDGDSSEENMMKLTSSRFYDVYNGEQLNPKIEFVQTFCDIAGIKFDYFFTVKPEGIVTSLTADEKEMVVCVRKLNKVFGVKHIIAYMKMLLTQQNEEK